MHRSDTLLTLLTKDTSGKSFNLEQLQDSSDFFFQISTQAYDANGGHPA